MDNSRLTAELHLRADEPVTMRDFTRTADPFVTLYLGDGALTLFVSDVETIDQLMATVAQARRALVAALGEDPGVIVRPVTDLTYLTPGRLPVGVV